MATVDRIESPIRLIVWNWVDRIRDSISLGELTTIMMMLSVLAATAAALWVLGPDAWRRVVRTTSIALIALYVLGFGWYAWRAFLDSRDYRIVMDTKVDAYSAPDSSATQVFTLHEGTRLGAGETVAGWTHISLADGRRGWLPTESVAKI
jgi:hypothetical protein